MFNKSTSYMLAVAASIYGILAYTIAFSLEIWFIFNNDNVEENSYSLNHKNYHNHEAQFIIPMTALIQASLYFILVIISLFLILGVIIKSIACLICWVVAIILAFLPETTLVVYTCLNVWKIETKNGQIELCFFVFRLVMNTFFVIFVYNLIKQWKTEKIMSSYAKDAYSAYPYITATSLRLKNPHINPTILASAANFDTYTKYNPNYDTMNLSDLAKFKSLSVKGLYDLTTYPYYTYFEGFETYVPNRNEQPFPSEFDTNSFRRYKMIRKPTQPIDLDLNEFNDLNEKKMIEEQPFYNSKKSLVTEIDSHSNSHSITNSINNRPINVMEQNQMNDNIVLRQLATKPFDYLNRPGSVMNLAIPFESDENFNNILNEKKNTSKKNLDKTKSVNSLRDVAL